MIGYKRFIKRCTLLVHLDFSFLFLSFPNWNHATRALTSFTNQKKKKEKIFINLLMLKTWL